MSHYHVRVWLDSQVIWTSPQPITFSLITAEITTETHSAADQMPGGKWDYEDFTNVRYALYGAQTYSSFGYNGNTTQGHRNDATNWYGNQWVNGQTLYPGIGPYAEMDTWDWFCY